MSGRDYRDFVIYMESMEADDPAARPRKFRVRVFDSPAGEGEHSEEITIDDWDKLEKWDTSLACRELTAAELQAFGLRLRELILPDYAFQLYRTCRAPLKDDEALRVRLRLPDDLAWLPWEYTLVKLHDGEVVDADYWALDQQVSIVRHQEISSPAQEFSSNPERRVIVALASPEPYEDYPRLDLAGEEKAIRSGLTDVAGVAVDYIPDFDRANQAERASQRRIQEALRQPADVFHFTGHGHYDAAERCGKIYLAEQDNVAEPVRAEALSRLLGAGHIRLAVLGACETGQRDMSLRWSSIATALLRGGIPSVVAMQYTVDDRLAKEFTRALYENLVRGASIDEAVSQARWAMYLRDGSRRDWGAPVLYLRNSGGHIFPPVTNESARNKAEQACERNSTLAQVSLRWARSAELASPAQQAVLRQGGEALDLTPADSVLLLHSAVVSDQPTDFWIAQLRKDDAKWLQQLEQGAASAGEQARALAEKHLGLESPEVGASPQGVSRLAWAAARSDDLSIGQTAAAALLALRPGQAVSEVQNALTQGVANGPQRGRRRAALLGFLAEEDPSIAKQLPGVLDNPWDRAAVWWWRARKHIYRNRTLLAGWIWGGALGAAFALGLYRALLGILNTQHPGTEFAIYALWGFILGLGLLTGMLLARPLLLRDFGQQGGDGRVATLSILLGGIGFSLANALVVFLLGIGVSPATFVLDLLGSFVVGVALSLGLLGQPEAGWKLGIGGWLKRLAPAAALMVVAQLPALFERVQVAGAYWIDSAVWTAASVITPSNILAIIYNPVPFIHDRFPFEAPPTGACFTFGGAALLGPCFPQWLTVLDAALVGLVLTVGITAGLHFSQTWLGSWWQRLMKRLDITR